VQQPCKSQVNVVSLQNRCELASGLLCSLDQRACVVRAEAYPVAANVSPIGPRITRDNPMSKDSSMPAKKKAAKKPAAKKAAKKTAKKK
jgi:hypothetical protein